MLFALAAALLVWAVIEVVCVLGLWSLARLKGIEYSSPQSFMLEGKQRTALEKLVESGGWYTSFSASLGWAINPDRILEKPGEPRYQSNGQGLRADHDYTIQPPPDVIRVATFGDSFTHCNDVSNEETWQSAMERLDGTLEVLNFGVGGYGLDQAYLRYLEEGRKFNPKVVVIGFMTENIFRNVNVFRPFYKPGSTLPLAKPRFLLDGDKLELAPNPIQSLGDYRTLIENPSRILPVLGQHDYFYQTVHSRQTLDWLPTVRFATLVRRQVEPAPTAIMRAGEYNTDSDAYRVTTLLFSAFSEAVHDAGAVPVVVLFPNRRDLEQRALRGHCRYQPLLEQLHSSDIKVVDLAPILAGHDPEGLFAGYHYSAQANAMVGATLAQVVRTAAESDRS